MSLLDPARAEEWETRKLRDRAALIALDRSLAAALEGHTSMEDLQKRVYFATQTAWAIADDFMERRDK